MRQRSRTWLTVTAFALLAVWLLAACGPPRRSVTHLPPDYRRGPDAAAPARAVPPSPPPPTADPPPAAAPDATAPVEPLEPDTEPDEAEEPDAQPDEAEEPDAQPDEAKTPEADSAEDGTGDEPAPDADDQDRAAATPPVTARDRIDRTGGLRPARRVVVYFTDVTAEPRALQPVEVLVPQTASVARSVVDELIRGAPEVGLVGGLPATTRVLGLNLREGVLTVDFSADFLAVDPGQEDAVVYGLIMSLTEFAAVEAVMVWVEGEPAPLPNGGLWAAPRSRPQADQVAGLPVRPLIPFSGEP